MRQPGDLILPNWSKWEKFRDCYSIFFVEHEKSRVKLATVVEGNPKALFLLAITPRWRGGCNSFLWIAPLYPWYPYNAVKQGGIKYHFLNFWYDSTWDWTLVSWAFGKHSSIVKLSTPGPMGVCQTLSHPDLLRVFF